MMGGVSASHLMGLSQKGNHLVPQPLTQVGFSIWGTFPSQAEDKPPTPLPEGFIPLDSLRAGVQGVMGPDRIVDALPVPERSIEEADPWQPALDCLHGGAPRNAA